MVLLKGSLLVAPEPLAAEVAGEIFADGGTAVDAAIATAFAQGVVNPVQCGIGGNGAMTLFLANSARTCTIDFGEAAGSRVHPRMWYGDFLGQARPAGRYLVRGSVNTIGYQAIAVPGFVRGMQAAWEAFGSLPWPRLLAPAIRLAAGGFHVYPYLERFWRRRSPPPYVEGSTTLGATAACAAIYTKRGVPFEVGELLVQPDLARTLQQIADEGPDTFYQGGIAARIAEDFAENGALITREDLTGYRARSSPPLTFTYRGHRIISEPPPGSGVQLAEMLAILEGFDLQGLGWNSPQYVRLLAETMKIGFADKVRHLGDPEFTPVPVAWLLSREYVAGQRRRIEEGDQVAVPLVPGTAPDARPPGPGRREGAGGAGTTHLSVVDALGNAVSLTHSICSSSGVVTPGLGFMYNNCMDQYCPDPDATPNPLMPGRRRATGSCATIVFRGSEPFLVLGGSGGNTIPTTVLQTILNVIDHGMPIQAAVSAPRVHCEGSTIEVEAPISAAVCRALERLGYEVNRSVLSYSETFGCVQAVQIAQDGARSAGADPRGGGGMGYLLQREV